MLLPYSIHQPSKTRHNVSWRVIFDWDGVVVDSSMIHKASWEDLAKKLSENSPRIISPWVLARGIKLSFRRFSNGLVILNKLRHGVNARRNSTGKEQDNGISLLPNIKPLQDNQKFLVQLEPLPNWQIFNSLYNIRKLLQCIITT